MKLLNLVIVLLLLLFAGCANNNENQSTNSLKYLQEKCIRERHIEIIDVWNTYEVKKKIRVDRPDWRVNSYYWAKAECDFGKPIPKFRP